MDQSDLFDLGEDGGVQRAETPPRTGPRRLRHAVRSQIEFQECSLDDLLSEEHEARLIWDYVCGLDLSELRARIQAVEGGPGQAPADPRILLALWLYATLRAVGSARELNRLCQEHVAQDGMKVRASAGAASFRRQPTLEEALAAAEEQLAKRTTAPRWPRGGNAWPPMKPSLSTGSAPRRPSASTPWPATAACSGSWSAACGKSKRSRCGMPWSIT